jgi:putative tricarboxylic transport membrane protein
VQFLRIPYRVLFPLILLLAVVGTYATNTNIFDVWIMIGFGVLGYLLVKLGYELGPFILALVLGPQFEQALRQSLIMSSQNALIFLTRPISAALLALAGGLLVVFFLGEWKKRWQAARVATP